ncbi:hypothetical protein AB0K60_19710 [Thermopolyspora sp. NPDC052614]|uniref:hypothetical protein n=1 Tax=Thermopolyspora sp. NPDC052614 TaxID=3155682 RepID=UPI003435816E
MCCSRPVPPSGARTAIPASWSEAGRPAEEITPALFVSVRIDDGPDAGRTTMDAYARATYGMPLAELEGIQAVVTGAAEQVLTGLRRYVAAGARHLVLRLGALDLHGQRDQLDRLTDLIRPLTAAMPLTVRIDNG